LFREATALTTERGKKTECGNVEKRELEKVLPKRGKSQRKKDQRGAEKDHPGPELRGQGEGARKNEQFVNSTRENEGKTSEKGDRAKKVPSHGQNWTM